MESRSRELSPTGTTAVLRAIVELNARLSSLERRVRALEGRKRSGGVSSRSNRRGTLRKFLGDF